MNDQRNDGLFKAVKKGQIRSCIVNQHQKTTFEYYSSPKYKQSAQPIHSISKSVISMLIGICMREGLIDDINTSIRPYFEPYFAKIKDRKKDEITVSHLLTMTPGFDWPEFGAWKFGSPMEYSKDMIGFVLDRALENIPGEKMIYNSGCSNLLSAIIQTISGMKTVDFAYRHLFGPLGLDDIIWHEKQGITLGANGLRMKPSDLLALGTLYLNQGLYQGKQLIPKEWISESTCPRHLTYPDIGHYGYHWWAADLTTDVDTVIPYYFAMGLFGQFLIVLPEYEMIVVFTSSNYGDTMRPMHILRELIIPALPPR